MGSQFELDEGDQIIVGIDVSASMRATDTPNSSTRIDYSKEATATLAREAEKFDKDGIDILTFGEKVTKYEGVAGDKINSIINGLQANEGTTNTHLLIQEAYKIHKTKQSKQTVLLVITDGAPANETAVKEAIRTVAAELKDEHEFAISFLQVGEDAGVAAFLAEIDDNLKAKHDIVDCKKLKDVGSLTEVVMGALHD